MRQSRAGKRVNVHEDSKLYKKQEAECLHHLPLGSSSDISVQANFSAFSCSRCVRIWHLVDEYSNLPDEVSVKTASIWPPTDCMVNGCSRGADTVLSSKPSITVSSSFKVKDTWGERGPQSIFSGNFHITLIIVRPICSTAVHVHIKSSLSLTTNTTIRVANYEQSHQNPTPNISLCIAQSWYPSSRCNELLSTHLTSAFPWFPFLGDRIIRKTWMNWVAMISIVITLLTRVCKRITDKVACVTAIFTII